MSEKKAVKLVIEANLECEKCYRKIQKILCKLQDKEKISNINYDTKNNTVTVSGGFDDAKKLCRKLRCKAREAIKDITIVVEEEKKKPAEEEKKKPEEGGEKKKPAEGEKKKPKEAEKKKPAEGDKKKPAEGEKPKPSSSSSTTVNVQFTQMCTLCYPWPCSDPTHWGHPQPQWPQWPPCEPAPQPGHHHHPPPYCPPPQCPPTPKRPCGGPAYCGGGCGSCGGGGAWPPAMPTPTHMMQPPPMMCAGGGCRGCKGQGCRIVQEGRFIYEEYPPPSACSIM